MGLVQSSGEGYPSGVSQPAHITSPCIEWQGYLDKNGYGITSMGTVRDGTLKNGVRAHRKSWIEAYGPIPEGLLVLHRCDNPSCVNPEHLFLGTQSDNMRDMWEKGKRRGRDPKTGKFVPKS
jgi:hypothetical protein